MDEYLSEKEQIEQIKQWWNDYGWYLLGGAALLWKGNPYLGLVVGASLAANTMVAVSFGGLVPLILRGLRADPALASGPLLTTITDMCGFFFVLSFASILLPKLSG